jgi:hypothetical protein
VAAAARAAARAITVICQPGMPAASCPATTGRVTWRSGQTARFGRSLTGSS